MGSVNAHLALDDLGAGTSAAAADFKLDRLRLMLVLEVRVGLSREGK